MKNRKSPRSETVSRATRRGRGSGRSKTGKAAVESAEKHARALELRKQGKSLQQIADALGYASPSGVHQALTRAIAQTVAEPAADVRALELLRLDSLLERAWRKVEAGDLAPGDFILRLMTRRAKLLGLDAPVQSKVELQEDFKIMPTPDLIRRVVDELLSNDERREALLAELAARGYKVRPPKGVKP